MRLRTASGLALASLAAAVAVMTHDSRSDGVTGAGSLDHAVIVIERGSPAAWNCPETAPPAP